MVTVPAFRILALFPVMDTTELSDDVNVTGNDDDAFAESVKAASPNFFATIASNAMLCSTLIAVGSVVISNGFNCILAEAYPAHPSVAVILTSTASDVFGVNLRIPLDSDRVTCV